MRGAVGRGVSYGRERIGGDAWSNFVRVGRPWLE